MKFSRLFLFLPMCFFMFHLSAASRSKHELINAGSWVYDDFNAICTEQGIVNFSDSTPITIQEFESYFSEIEYSLLSEPAKKKYEGIRNYLEESIYSFDSDLLSLGVEPSISLSGFIKNNDDVPWVYDRFSRKPFIGLPVTISASDYFNMRMDLVIAQNKNSSLKNDNYTNVPVSPDDMDINFPDSGYLAFGKKLSEGSGIGFVLGKGTQQIGNSLTGSMIWSDHLTGVSYGKFSAYSPNFKYTGSVSQFNVDRYMYMHQLDARFFKKLQLSALEGCFVNAPVELRFLNPWTIYHGMAPWREYEPDSYDSETHVCAYLGLKFQFIPFKNWKIYGNYAQTQFQTSYETSNYPNDTTPNGIGAQLGSEVYFSCGEGLLRISAEGSWADPYLYIKESPNWTLVKTYCENSGSKRHPFYEWIGSPFGPDTVTGKAQVQYSVSEKYTVGLSYLFAAKGEMSGDSVFNRMRNADGEYLWGGQRVDEDYPEGWCYPDKDKTDASGNPMGLDEAKRRQKLSSPSGTPEYVNRLSISAEYHYNKSMSFLFQPSYVIIFNDNHIQGNTQKGFEFVAAFNINLINIK